MGTPLLIRAQPSFPAQPPSPLPARPCPSFSLTCFHLLSPAASSSSSLVSSSCSVPPSPSSHPRAAALTPSASPLPTRGSPSPSVPQSLTVTASVSASLSLLSLLASYVLRIVRRRFVALRGGRSLARRQPRQSAVALVADRSPASLPRAGAASEVRVVRQQWPFSALRYGTATKLVSDLVIFTDLAKLAS